MKKLLLIGGAGIIILMISIIVHQPDTHKEQTITQKESSHSILLKETDLYIFCKENIKDCQILAEESKFFTEEQKTECKNITCKITTNKNEQAILKAHKAYINHKEKKLFLPGTVTGVFKTWSLKKQQVLYDTQSQIITAKNTKLYSQNISIESLNSSIDLQSEIVHFKNGVTSTFVRNRSPKK